VKNNRLPVELAKDMLPVRVCRACGSPKVGWRMKKCPACGVDSVRLAYPARGTIPWDDVRPWVPVDCLVVVDESEN